MSRNRSNRTPQQQSTGPDYWDGIDRRNDDRRQFQYPPYGLPYAYPNNQTGKNDIADTTLTLQQIGGIIVVLGSLVFSGFSAWNNLNKDIDSQKVSFEQFKTQVSKDITDIQASVIDIRRINEDIKLQNQKTYEALDRRIQDLDTSVTQMYQKVRDK